MSINQSNFQRPTSTKEILDALSGISAFLAPGICEGSYLLIGSQFYEENLPKVDGGYVIGKTLGQYGLTVAALVWYPKFTQALLDYY